MLVEALEGSVAETNMKEQCIAGLLVQEAVVRPREVGQLVRAAEREYHSILAERRQLAQGRVAGEPS